MIYLRVIESHLCPNIGCSQLSGGVILVVDLTLTLWAERLVFDCSGWHRH